MSNRQKEYVVKRTNEMEIADKQKGHGCMVDGQCSQIKKNQVFYHIGYAEGYIFCLE